MVNRLLRLLQIRQRLWLLVSLTLVSAVLLTIETFNYSSHQFVELQKNNTQTQVEGAKKIVEYFYNRSQNGDLSSTEAKRQALATIEALRPDERTYFYIYHKSDFLVMHPFLKEQVFSDETPEIIEESHKQFIAQLEKNAIDHNFIRRGMTSVELFNLELSGKKSGFIEYLYYVDENDFGAIDEIGSTMAPVDADKKLAYGSLFEPWQWVIFGGVYLGDLDDIYFDLVVEFVIPALIGMFVLALLVLSISRSITLPLNDTVTTIKNLTANENFNKTLNDSSADEIGTLSRAFNALLVRIRDQSSQLREKNKTLEHHRIDLEEKIESRTHNLALATEQAQTANKAKSEFLATMSHELRTPLNGILGVLTLIEDSKMSDEVRDSLEIVQSSAHQLLSIVNDILDFEKLDNDRVKIESISFSPDKLLQQVCSVFDYEVANKGIDFELKLETEVPKYFKGDPLRIKQIFNNLVSNAVKFTETGKVTIAIYWHESNQTLNIKVIDSGIGIAENRVNSIFNSFVQADSTTTRQYGGTGLGLGISKKLIELLNGEITVTSELGKGSCFSVNLPLVVTDEPPEVDHRKSVV